MIKVFGKTVYIAIVQAFRNIFSLQTQHGLSVYQRAYATEHRKGSMAIWQICWVVESENIEM